MSYLGRGVDKISNIETLDNITFDGSSSYTLQKGGSNFTPSSASAILLSIDGVIQSGNFTCSGSTIDFGTAVAGTSTCNFIIHLGVGLITAPADNAVTTAKIADDAVTEAKLNLISTSSVPSLEAKGDGSSQDGYIQLNCSQNSHGIKLKSPPHSAGQSYTLTFPQSISADTFLKTDGSGNLSFASAGESNKPAFLATMSAQSVADNTYTKLAFATEVVDTNSAYDHSTNYRFTVPSGEGGLYYFTAMMQSGGMVTNSRAQIVFAKNGSRDSTTMARDYAPTNSLSLYCTASSILSLSASDYIEVEMLQASGSTQSAGYGQFGGFKICSV